MSRPALSEGFGQDGASLACVLDRVVVVDDVLSDTEIVVLSRWALQTPHWMLSNSAYNDRREAQHRIWGASYIGDWRRGGWPALPPVLFSAIASVCHRLRVHFDRPSYIGLNGQLRGQDASIHTDCERDSRDQLSVLIYVGENTTGDLVLYDKASRSHEIDRVAFRPNRVVAFDGSIPHRALAPVDDRFRMSIIVRGTYSWRGS